jgi:integrase
MRVQRYLKQDTRSRNWVYRREFPRDVGEINGTKTFVRSFGTTDLAQANRQWSTFDAEYEAKLQQARSLAIYRTSKDARREKFWLSVARWIEFQKTRHEGQLVLPHPSMVPPTSTVDPESVHTFTTLRNSFQAWAADHDHDALAVFRMGDARLDSLFELGLVGSFFVALETQNIGDGKKSIVPSGSGTMLGEVLAKFKAEKRRSPQTYADMIRSIDTLACACGGEAPTVEATTKEHMQKFRAYLVKQEQWKGRTKNKVRANLSSLYSHAQTLFLIEHNPVELVATFDQDDSEKRKPFSDTDLKAILEQDAFKAETRATCYWIPLLSLFTAARQGELGQLDRTDVYPDPDSGLWVMSITNEGEDQSTKTEQSRRLIPVPAAILKLGFVEFVQSVKAGPLFGLKRSPSGAFPNLSADLNAMIREAGITDPLKVFHSYRHTTRTKARTFKITEEAMDFIAGHASANVGRRYGTHELPTLKREIDKIKYEVRIPKWSP